MAVKKTVKKRRTVKKAKTDSIEKLIEALQNKSELSAVIKRAIARFNKTNTAIVKQQKLVATDTERVEKARAAVANTKTPAAKEKAKVRLGLAQGKLKEDKAELKLAITEQKKSERLIKGLHKAMQSALVKMQRDYERSAKSLEKSIDKPLRRRRTRKKRVTQPEEGV